ncbi:hypothetical protein DPMN_097967 [Dreissena polymorpha]|uniref:Uncharacterized protein n=1 Tax=Dreissena polymorpha TaxID=45954 RepID=A0A9D4LC54_DREPO|nr:hypothetical protein DPMN_097967 [Dreissena polymorpha]
MNDSLRVAEGKVKHEGGGDGSGIVYYEVTYELVRLSYKRESSRTLPVISCRLNRCVRK